MSILQFLQSHAGAEPVAFHMPGHKGSAIYKENGFGEFLEVIMDADITEIPGADNLFQPESVIRETMEKYRKLYGAKNSYLLINGSSAGILAAILSSVPRGGKLIMARNCHKSVFNALTLGAIEPVYAYPEIIEEYGIQGAVAAAEISALMDANPEASAVILPSPNYYGICSDIEAIAKVVHEKNKILIVDQAHGAHLKFFDGASELKFPKAAEEAGADIVINSAHKTLASFTQTAVLNVCSDRVDLFDLEDKLQILESSSPSYPLMASLDANADLLLQKGDELMKRWEGNLLWFYREAKAIPGLRLMEARTLDKTKLNIDMSAYGFDGDTLENYLMERDIFVELISGNLVMCMTGIGNKKEDYQRLLGALCEIADTNELVCQKPKQPQALVKKLKWSGIPTQKERVSIDDAVGRVCASAIIPYPPGIPIACPGEILDEEVTAYVRERREAAEKVIGISENLEVWVGK